MYIVKKKCVKLIDSPRLRVLLTSSEPPYCKLIPNRPISFPWVPRPDPHFFIPQIPHFPPSSNISLSPQNPLSTEWPTRIFPLFQWFSRSKPLLWNLRTPANSSILTIFLNLLFSSRLPSAKPLFCSSKKYSNSLLLTSHNYSAVRSLVAQYCLVAKRT